MHPNDFPAPLRNAFERMVDIDRELARLTSLRNDATRAGAMPPVLGHIDAARADLVLAREAALTDIGREFVAMVTGTTTRPPGPPVPPIPPKHNPVG